MQDSKQRLKAMQKCNQPITDGAYSSDGSIYAYSVCYDWSRGHAEHNPANAKSHILLHSPHDNEVLHPLNPLTPSPHSRTPLSLAPLTA